MTIVSARERESFGELRIHFSHAHTFCVTVLYTQTEATLTFRWQCVSVKKRTSSKEQSASVSVVQCDTLRNLPLPFHIAILSLSLQWLSRCRFFLFPLLPARDK